MIKLKILAAIFFVALLFSLSLNNQKTVSRDVINHVSTPSPISTEAKTNSQTYENKLFNFYFNYPHDWFLKGGNFYLEIDSKPIELSDSRDIPPNNIFFDLNCHLKSDYKKLGTQPCFESKNFDEYLGKLTDKFKKDSIEVNYLSDEKQLVTIVSGYLPSTPWGGFYKTAVFERDGYILSLNTINQSLINTFDQILYSLNFDKKPLESKLIDSIDFVYTTDGCLRISGQLYNSQISLTDFIKQKYNLTSDLPLSEKQYKYKNYRSITILPMNMAEVDNIFVDLGKQKLHILIEANNPEGSPVCRLDYEKEIQNIVEKLYDQK